VKLSRNAKRVVGIVAAIVGVGLIGEGVVWSRIDHAASVSNATKADAVVVLGCAVQKGGTASPALRARIQEGVRVWRATGSRYLFVTGGVGKNPPAEAVVMRGIAEREGVPPASIINDTTAHTTEGSAFMCARVSERLGWHRVILVSDPWHLLRARHMFTDYDAALDVRQSPAFDSPDWTDTGRRTGYTLRESIAFPIYMFRRHVL
jgi:uncharacterized SAM-binding protein YcdF (DUF218 family)